MTSLTRDWFDKVNEMAAKYGTYFVQDGMVSNYYTMHLLTRDAAEKLMGELCDVGHCASAFTVGDDKWVAHLEIM